MPSNVHQPTKGVLTIDGVSASDRLAPADARELAAILAEAASRGGAVAPVGGGTALALGNPPERLDLVLSTERLSQIIDYEPTDLVLSVGAGARLGDVQAVLGEHGQRLPIDPPGGGDATIGGLIATALWGPLRHSAGTLRDLLIGISVAHPSGTLSKAGGMVVKNVSGYDMPRLYLGSLGTLGVVTSANFKVLPRPRAESTILMTFATLEEAFAAADGLRASRAPLAALDMTREEGAWLLAARIEGREQTVATVADRIASVGPGQIERLEPDASRRWWDEYISRQDLKSDDDTVLVRCAVRPRATMTLALGVVAAMEETNVNVQHLAVSPGIGVVVARLRFASDGSPDKLADAQSLLVDLADTMTILAAPAAWKRGIDVWGRIPEGFDVMKALRAEFDPARTINPGRFAGFL
jgi:glycolate oxidase FAD binding subunit